MPTFKAPLSGDVIQAINPWQWVWNASGGQYGLVNINLGRSSDPDLEQTILDEVGSYGRQLGRIGDVVEILLRAVDPKKLSEADQKKVRDFQVQLEDIRKLKDARQRA